MSKITTKIDYNELTAHVKRICKSNMKKPAKICLQCPFKKYVLQIMDANDWKYHKSLKQERMNNGN